MQDGKAKRGGVSTSIYSRITLNFARDACSLENTSISSTYQSGRHGKFIALSLSLSLSIKNFIRA